MCVYTVDRFLKSKLSFYIVSPRLILFVAVSYVTKYGSIMLCSNIMSHHKSYPIASHDII